MSKSQIVQEVETANSKYVASFGEKGKLALPPSRRFAVLTCMDARLDPAKYAGLAEGDAHVIRNAGGRASDDAIRSLVISYKLLGTKEFFVVHHTDCGMVLFNSKTMGGLLEKSLETAVHDGKEWKDVGKGPGSKEGQKVDWMTFTDDEKAVVEDVKRIRNHPLVPKSIPVYGYLYDVRTGKLKEIGEATTVGRAGA